MHTQPTAERDRVVRLVSAARVSPDRLNSAGPDGTRGLPGKDVTGDGKPDVVVANKGSASVTLLEGQGDGTLKPLGSLVVQAAPESIAIADLDKDGLGDIVVANEDAGSISLLYGKK